MSDGLPTSVVVDIVLQGIAKHARLAKIRNIMQYIPMSKHQQEFHTKMTLELDNILERKRPEI